MKTYEVTVIKDRERQPPSKQVAETSYAAAEAAEGVHVRRWMGHDDTGADMFLMRSGVLAVVAEV